MKDDKRLPVVTVGILITGNIVGAGILGLPINTGLAGFPLSSIAMLVMWGLMLATALILSDQILSSHDDRFDLPSLFGETLGVSGKWIAVSANLLILYGLLVAYLSGSTSILMNLFNVSLPAPVVTVIFFCFNAGLTLFGSTVVRKGNAFLMIAMWVAFVVLIIIAFDRIQPDRLAFMDWTLLPSGIPILVTAFHFHNIIPTACKSLEYDRNAVRKALLLGTGIGLAMNLVWTVVVIGGIPIAGSGSDTILHAFDNGLPATVPLSNILNSKLFTLFGLLFAILAITTSFLANGMALMGFVQDMCSGVLKKRNPTLEIVLTFGPPLLVTMAYPNLFLKALDLVGGVGIALLFGILPGILAVRQAKSSWGRNFGYLIVACFAAVLLFEICQEIGLLKIDPDAELFKMGLKVGSKTGG
jgi:tyrosine-specific transport protein